MGIFNATAIDPHDVDKVHRHALLESERVLFAFKTVRDFIVFTEWRLLYIDVQGITGSKTSYLTIPYRSITSFAIVSAGTFDLDAEIKLSLSGLAPIEFKIGRSADVRGLQTLLASKLDR
ncbi:PH domain-containing protein [Sphingomonas sp. BAUL-RG-20F-R05-02]|uniref:PH domain-containing protein n=1 Tax=Sphingomonas sp. BAUL-RG-20F-R05-02 TaxID=2914830 RepID=UPI001F563EE2|nr:PH domain-containing protein [Sphingomonas sp. BAUL-RG-20F-R05-02]